MKVSEFEYHLPQELIAQEPIETRDSSNLLILDRKDKSLKEVIFKEIANFIEEGDVLVLNDTRVIKARLIGKRRTGGRVELLLLREKGEGVWESMANPLKKIRLNEDIYFAEGKFSGKVIEKTEVGTCLIGFNPPGIRNLIIEYGKIPLPHYIKKDINDPERYQTVYAEKDGAIAAPTAGLHFTNELLRELSLKGVKIAYISLHCGPATFKPVIHEDIREHKMAPELYEVPLETAEIINNAKRMKKKIFAVGTTAVKALETAGFIDEESIPQVRHNKSESGLYIYPGYKFKIIDALLTNFHLPRSTNLILVSAFAGVDFIHQAYQYAIEKRFRFYSFGDAMLIT
ncbi:MAG: tRNA preQ1(34) S-adenosylmethionine ribosyltransferase-isomerase QueA [Candidatus Omnitrophica bacterium]|nr:tRNA preQ1(34) S-adenosylmethionine ribosyltransferase-isomerase QueA [Candidatus Omnitrophota bacterium]